MEIAVAGKPLWKGMLMVVVVFGGGGGGTVVVGNYVQKLKYLSKLLSGKFLLKYDEDEALCCVVVGLFGLLSPSLFFFCVLATYILKKPKEKLTVRLWKTRLYLEILKFDVVCLVFN